jgi:DNA-binding winged helix-turn-helix (wHTH) protein/tetratricopeptide (TPR) repeat protein
VKRFANFTLDTANQCVLRGSERVQLTPKAFSVLSYLVENADRLVTKNELLDAVWPDTFVQEAVLKVCILEIRKALGESGKESKHIDTVHRRGYRFVSGAPVIEEPAKPSVPAQESTLLGRDAELHRLRGFLHQAFSGQRQVVFLIGEAGIGKSSLVSSFMNDVGAGEEIQVLQGNCVEHLGSQEAYYPIFQALGRAAKPGRLPNLVPVLRKYAPTWLAEMPALVEDTQALRHETLGSNRDRMLREMSEAIEALTADHLLILVLEDLHWSDVSTLDLIASIAHRTEDARLLLIATYRPVDVILSNHPVRTMKQTLATRGRCSEIELEELSKEHVAALFERRFPDHEIPSRFVDLVHHRTDGNPLFVLNVLDDASARALITHVEGAWRLSPAADDPEIHVPESISQMIEARFERLAPEQKSLLETASVAGLSFDLSLLNSGNVEEDLTAESCCDELARKELFLRPAAGADANLRYDFTHALYREVIYRRIPKVQRVRLHRMIGERIESRSAERVDEMAAELALHFAECREFARAIRYLRTLARRSATRQALPEALDALTRALALCPQLGEPAASQTTLDLVEQVGLLYRLMGRFDLAAAEFERMAEKARETRNPAAQLRAQLWLASVCSWLNRARCLKAVESAISLCVAQTDPALIAHALGHAAYWNLLFRGWSDVDAQVSAKALDAARKRGDRDAISIHASRHAFFLALATRYQEACATAEEGVRTALEIESLADYSIGHFYQAWTLLHMGEWGRMGRLLKQATAVAERNGHELWIVLFTLLEAMRHVTVFSFAHARRLGEDLLKRARALNHGLSIQMGIVVLGWGELGSGNLEEASEMFEEVRAWHKRERVLMDWIWALPLQLGIVELELARGNAECARTEAQQLLALTGPTAERTWKGLAHYAMTKAAIAAGDIESAKDAVANGLKTIQGWQTPMPAWRLHSLAARLTGENDHALQASAIKHQLADSLADEPELQRAFVPATNTTA